MQLSIVSYLDPTSSLKVRELQRTLSEITGSFASLKSWEPHITLGDGVEIENNELQSFESLLKSTTSNSRPFDLELTGFSSKDNRPIGVNEKSTPYVIYIDVITNNELLQLVSEIAAKTSTMKKWYYMPQPYLPHVTLAFRDLTEEGYKLGLEYLKNKDISITTRIDHVALVEKLPDKDTERVRIQLQA